jgi:hypothetical protein
MTSYHLSDDNRFSVSLAVRSLGVKNEFTISSVLCSRVEVSVSAYLAETAGGANLVQSLRSLALLLIRDDTTAAKVRGVIAALPAAALEQIESRALRLADQVPACAIVGSDLLSWAKVAPAADLIPLLRLCVVDGGAVLLGRNRSSGRQSGPHLEPIVFGRGRAVPGLPKLEGGRPADNAEVRLIAHLAVDWLESTGVEPEAGRDGHSPFSGLVYSVFGWLDIEDKAQHCLRQYWTMTKVKRVERW